GTVYVRARVAEDWIEVTVEDEGIGIADGDHERIFDRFFQGEAGDRRRFGGVGIGLFIVRRLAEAQHGEVTASSRPQGGTSLCLRLQPAEGYIPRQRPLSRWCCARSAGACHACAARRPWLPGRQR